MKNEEAVLENILSRHSVRQFAAGAVTDTDIEALLRAAMQAPSAGNEQAWAFVVLDGATLAAYCAEVSNVPGGASDGILVCLDEGREKYPEFRTALQDCAAAVQNLLLAAHARGLGAVWTAVFPQGLVWLKKRLGLPDGIVPFAVIPLGRPARDEGVAASRFDPDRVHRLKW